MPPVTIRHIDARGLRFAAAAGTVVMAIALLLGPTFGLPFVAIQTLVFAMGSIMGMRANPYVVVYQRWVRPRLKVSTHMAPEPPSRFAGGLGMLIGVSAMIAGTLMADWWYYLAAGLVFTALFLEATLKFCAGCAVYNRMASNMRTLPVPAESREGSSV